MHFANNILNWPDGLRGAFPFLVKTINRGDMCREAKQVNPNVITDLRYWNDAAQVFGGDWEYNLGMARWWFSQFIDGTFRSQYAPYVDYVEERNEYLANSQTEAEIVARLNWAGAAAWVWEREYRTSPELAHIKLVLCNAAVGNWIDRRFAVIARDHDCVIGYHPYTLWERKVRWSGDWLNLSGLWAVMEDEWDLDDPPYWMFTECGPFQAAEDGWRSPNCLGGDPVLLIEAMRQWAYDCMNTDAGREGRIVGTGAWYTSGGGKQWESYELTAAELVPLGDLFESEWAPVEPAPEPEDPVTTPLPVPAGLPCYSQRDPRWASDPLGVSSLTLGGYGCAVTCAAMLAARVDPSITPGTLNAALIAAGGFAPNEIGELTFLRWQTVADIVDGLEYAGWQDWQSVAADMSQVWAALARGPIVLWVDYYPLTVKQDSHFVIGYAPNGSDDVWIIDPWDGSVGSLRAKYAQVGWTMARAIYGYREYAVVEPVPVEPVEQRVVYVTAPSDVLVKVKYYE